MIVTCKTPCKYATAVKVIFIHGKVKKNVLSTYFESISLNPTLNFSTVPQNFPRLGGKVYNLATTERYQLFRAKINPP